MGPNWSVGLGSSPTRTRRSKLHLAWLENEDRGATAEVALFFCTLKFTHSARLLRLSCLSALFNESFLLEFRNITILKQLVLAVEPIANNGAQRRTPTQESPQERPFFAPPHRGTGQAHNLKVVGSNPTPAPMKPVRLTATGFAIYGKLASCRTSPPTIV